MDYNFDKTIISIERLGTSRDSLDVERRMEGKYLIHLSSIDHDLTYIYLYSDIIQFFNQEEPKLNKEKNLWVKFLESDDSITLALILNTNIDKVIDSVTQLLSDFDKSKNKNKELKIIIKHCRDLIILIDYWLNNISEDNVINISLNKFILSDIIPVLRIVFLFDHSNIIKLEFIKIYDDFIFFLKEMSKKNSIWDIDTFNIKSDAHNSNFENKEIFLETIKNIIFLITSYIKDIKGQVKNNFESSIFNKNHKPHIGLFLCFLNLLEEAKKLLNDIPSRFQNYYYKKILEIEEKEAIPDSAFINLNLKFGKNYYLEKGTKFLGGKDSLGEDIIFETIKDVELVSTKIERIYIAENNIYERTNNRKKLIDSIKIKEYDNLEISSQKPLEGKKENTKLYKSGIIIENKILYLENGDRYVYINFKLSKESFEIALKKLRYFEKRNIISGEFYNLLSKILIIKYTSKDKWEEINNWTVSINKNQEDTITFTLFLDKTKKEFSYNDKITSKENKYKISSPALKFQINTDNYYDRISLFENLFIEKISIRVEVKNYKKLSIEDDYGSINTEKDFRFLGAIPSIGNSLYIECKDILAIKPSVLEFNIEWKGLPECGDGFKKYYEEYSTDIKNEDFKVNAQIMYNEKWISISKDSIFLFELDKKDEKGNYVLSKNKKITLYPKIYLENSDALSFFEKKKNTGKLKFSLISPPMAFGHSVYNDLTKKNVISSVKDKITQKNPLLPPYTPLVSSIFANYQSETEINLGKNIKENFYSADVKYIHPFGFSSYINDKSEAKISFLPSINSTEGEIFYKNDLIVFLGLERSDFSYLSIHVEVDNQYNLNANEISLLKIQVAKEKNWENFDSIKIISDTTLSFTQSGTIEIKLKKEIINTSNTMGDDLFWIRIYRSKFNSSNISKIKGIYVNGVKTQRVFSKSKKENIDILKSGSLNALCNKSLNEILKINQPFPSFGFLPKESEEHFFFRVRNRISHKNRPLSIEDYEKIILEKFENISLVKCINNCSKNKCHIDIAGHITVVVIPKGDFLENSNDLVKLILLKIKNFLEEITSPHIEIEVTTPTYEQIKIFADIKLKNDFSEESTVSELNNIIFKNLEFNTKYEDGKLKSDTVFHPSSLYKLILSNKEVEYINDYRIVKYYEINGKKYLKNFSSFEDKILPTLPWAFLTSSKDHIITVSNKKNHKPITQKIGIGEMSINKDFTIGPWKQKINKKIEQKDKQFFLTSTENFITFNIKNEHHR